MHSGMVPGSGGGRTDNVPLNVTSGNYILPADITSGLGEGSSLAGAKMLDSFFAKGPLGMPVMRGQLSGTDGGSAKPRGKSADVTI